jgi:hypothetical protein
VVWWEISPRCHATHAARFPKSAEEPRSQIRANAVAKIKAVRSFRFVRTNSPGHAANMAAAPAALIHNNAPMYIGGEDTRGQLSSDSSEGAEYTRYIGRVRPKPKRNISRGAQFGVAMCVKIMRLSMGTGALVTAQVAGDSVVHVVCGKASDARRGLHAV